MCAKAVVLDIRGLGDQMRNSSAKLADLDSAEFA